MSESLDSVEIVNANERPVFLKVLCILTFIGAGLGIIFGLWGVFTVQASIASLEASESMMRGLGGDFGTAMNAQIAALKQWGVIAQVLSLVGAILCLLGALQMWKLKKVGFYIYVVGQILPLVATFGLMGGVGMGLFASFAILGAIFPIAFIVMYALNLKHLR